MLLAFPFTAGAAYDKTTENAAAERMYEHHMIKGDANGDLRLGGTITRAEMVTLIVRAFGQEELATSLKGAPIFSDSASHWASGYIAAAKKLIEDRSPGTSVGKGDGVFDPDGNLTSAESLAFLMKFIGVKADLTLSWPDSYIQAAVKAGLISAEDASGLDEIKNAPANRGYVFYVADRIFDSFKVDGGSTIYERTGTTAEASPSEDPAPAPSSSSLFPVQALPAVENIHIVHDQVGQVQLNVLYPAKEIAKVIVYDRAEGGKVLGEASEVIIFRGENEVIPYISVSIPGGFPADLKAAYVVVVDAQGNASAPVERRITE